MEKRFHAACEAAGKLIKQGHLVYSPIAHSHSIAVRCELPKDWEFWQRVDREYIKWVDEVQVLCLPGWEESTGIENEIKIAKELEKPVWYWLPEVNLQKAAEGDPW